MLDLDSMLPELKNRQTRFDRSLFLYAMIGNLVLDLFFWVVGQESVALLSLVGAMNMLICFILIKYGRVKTVLLSGLITIIYLVFLWDFSFGWNYGAHYFLITAALLTAVTENISKKIKNISLIILTFFYFFLMAILSQVAPAARLPDWISRYTLDINILVSMGAIGFSLAKYKSTVIENEKALKRLTLKLARAANTDELTTIPNRRHIHQILSSSIENFDLTTDKFIIALVDVDDFKAINDQFGHDCGDRVLKEISLRMKSCLRKSDKIGRWGGEEFLVFLPNTEFPHGIEIIDRMRKTIGEKPFVTGDTSTIVTITAGVAEFHPETNLQDIINLADRRLYTGKRNGKNCVVGHDEDLRT